MFFKYFIKWFLMSLIRLIKMADDEKENITTNLMNKADFSFTKSNLNSEIFDERRMNHSRISEKMNSKKHCGEFMIKKYEQNIIEEEESKNKHKSLLIKKNDHADNHINYWIQENNGLFTELTPEYLNFIKKLKKRINYESILTDMNYLKAKKRSVWPFLKYVYTPERLDEAFNSKDSHLKYSNNQPCTFLDIFEDLKITNLEDLNDFNISFKIICDTIDHLMILKILSCNIDFYTIRLILNVIDCTKRLMCSSLSDPTSLYFICKTNQIVCQDERDLVLCYSFALIKNILSNAKIPKIYKFASFFSGIKFKSSHNPQKIIVVKQKNDGKVIMESVKYADYIFSHVFHVLTIIYDEVFE